MEHVSGWTYINLYQRNKIGKAGLTRVTQHMSHDWLKKCHPDIHISMLIYGNKIHSGLTCDWSSRNTSNDYMIIGTEMYFPGYHTANSTSYSTSVGSIGPK